MVPELASMIDGFFVEPEKHKVIGGEMVLYMMFTAFAVFIGWACTDILRFARERRRARAS